jgi:hypothetical protein
MSRVRAEEFRLTTQRAPDGPSVRFSGLLERQGVVRRCQSSPLYDLRLGTSTLELPPIAANGRVHARRRKITSNDRCHIAIEPNSEGAVTEAVELIKEALLYREAQ